MAVARRDFFAGFGGFAGFAPAATGAAGLASPGPDGRAGRTAGFLTAGVFTRAGLAGFAAASLGFAFGVGRAFAAGFLAFALGLWDAIFAGLLGKHRVVAGLHES